MQKGLILLTLFVFLSPLFSFDTQTLSTERYWQQLLHFRDGKSEIDSADFFLSPKGKVDAQAELEATLDAIYHDREVFCRFPARVKWLYEKIPTLENYQTCESLENLIENYQASKAVLVFPTAHINSPASMFGHTFLRLDDKKGLALTANAINYAAKTQESNGLVFAYQGLFGGYEGRYSVLPYYKKIKEYNNLERRDIWEYTLNLDEEELVRLLTHLYELKDIYADYFFFTENCSYNLLWLLEVARSDTHLVEQFSIKAIPIDTIRAVKKAGFIEDVHFRPSKTKKIKSLMLEEKRAKGALKEAYKAELGVELLQLKRTQKKIEKKPYVRELMARLKKRSMLATLPKLDIKPPENPLLAHKSARVTLGFDNEKEIEFGMKLAFHDIYDLEKGFISGAYIDFFHLLLSKSKSGDVKLENLNLLNINSYAPRDSVFKPLSWGVTIGAEDFRDEIYMKLTGEVGVTYALAERAFAFIMIAPKVYYHDKPLVGVAPKIGVLADVKNMKWGFMAERTLYSDGGRDVQAEAFATIMISANSALNFKVNHDKIEEKKSSQTYGVRLFYYF